MSAVRPLSWPRLFAYGGINFPVATIGLPLSIYLAPFYGGDVGLPLAAIGTAMLLGRLTDIITDPLIGWLSDRWHSRLGRRRAWLLIGPPVLLVSSWMLFNPLSHTLAYFLVWLTLTYLGFTMLQLPYLAWGAELSTNYEQRNRINTARQIFNLAGLIAATLLPAWILGHRGAGAGDVLHGLSLLMLLALPLFTMISFIFVPEPPVCRPASERQNLLRSLRQMWRNPPYRRINFVLLCGYAAETFRITITLFFARDVIGLTNVGLIYVYYFIVGFLFVPFWGWFGNRVGKHRALAVAFVVVALSTMAIFTLHRGQVTAFTLLFLVKGVCFGSLELLPHSMLADSADVDSVMSRSRRQGQLFAVTLLVVKLGQAIGQGLSLNLLALAGYHAIGENSAQAIFWLRIFYCVVPPVILLAMVPILWRYPLTAARHRRFQQFVETRLGKGNEQ